MKDARSSYKRNLLAGRKRNFDNETNWNYLFLNQDAVTQAFADRHGVDKSQILDKEGDEMAVKVSQIESQIIQETKQWMTKVGLNIKAIEGRNDRKEVKRSDKILLVKNIRTDMTENTLRDMFSRYG